MSFFRVLFLVFMAATLSACGGKSIWATDEAVAQRSYKSPEAPYLMLKSMINNRTGSGGHASLVINAPSQLVMYDPAGRWFHSWAPERNDVLFGMQPALMAQYDSFHARDTHHVVSQKIYVTPEVAQKALQLAFAKGPSPDGLCANNVSSLLRELQGFGGIKQTYFPAKLMREFAELQGVETTKHFENDVGQN